MSPSLINKCNARKSFKNKGLTKKLHHLLWRVESGLSEVNLREVYLESGVAGVISSFGEGLIGLDCVKSRIKEVGMFVLVQLVRKRMGLGMSGGKVVAHMSFTGASGTGKTLVARRLASVLHQLGVISRGHLVVATREDLVGQYIGHTSPKTKAVLKKAEGGVLLIDDAYHLYRPGNARDYGAEVIEVLLQCMEKARGSLVVVFAGYKPQMELIFKFNPGLASRVLCHIDFPNYTVIELMLIAFLVCEERQYVLDQEAMLVLWSYLEGIRGQCYFANARTVQNKVTSAILRHSRRLFSGGLEGGGDLGITKAQIFTLTKFDFEV
jgi:probable Rubsico expression protein CbbX